MMLKITLFLLLLLPSIFCFASEDDLSKMTPKELLEFYKKNPDHGKNKLSIDYEKYKDWDYVVWRGELLNASWAWIPNQMVKFKISRLGKEYITTTNKNWIFNFEVKKSLFDDRNYLFTMKIDNNQVQKASLWINVKNSSIFHFKIKKDKTYIIEDIHNNFFWENRISEWIDKIKRPSFLGIQGTPLFLLSFIILFLGWFFVFKDQFIASRTKKIKKIKKNTHLDISPQMEEMKEIQSQKKIDFTSLK